LTVEGPVETDGKEEEKGMGEGWECLQWIKRNFTNLEGRGLSSGEIVKEGEPKKKFLRKKGHKIHFRCPILPGESERNTERKNS